MMWINQKRTTDGAAQYGVVADKQAERFSPVSHPPHGAHLISMDNIQRCCHLTAAISGELGRGFRFGEGRQIRGELHRH